MKREICILRTIKIIIIVALILSVINSLIPRKIFNNLQTRMIFQIEIDNFDSSLQEYIFLENETEMFLQAEDKCIYEIKKVLYEIEGKPRLNVFGLSPSMNIKNGHAWPIFSLFSAEANPTNSEMVIAITHYFPTFKNADKPLPFKAIYLYLGEKSIAVKSERFFTKYIIENGSEMKEKIIEILKQNKMN